MRYLYGDSTESDLQINYLAFLKQVIDCAVLLMKHKVGRATATDRRRLREQDTAAAIKSLEDLGAQIAQNYQPVMNDTTPIGRVMGSMVQAATEAIDRESHALRAASRSEVDREIQEDRGDRMRCIAALEALLCAHDLPAAEVSRDVLWRDTPRAHLNARAKYATASLTLEIPAASVLAGELRVDRLVEGLEVLALEEGGWIKKNHKLVPHRVGRYVITRVAVTRQATSIRLRAEGGGGLDIEVPKAGDVSVERLGDNALREPTVDAKMVPGFRQLADKLEAAVNALDKKTGLTSFEIDGVSILDHHQPHILAERLIEVIAPVVQTIAKHSRNPDELVLRRLLGDDRREEIFVTIKELASKLDPLPPDARQVFAPLGFVAPEPVPATIVSTASAPAAAAVEDSQQAAADEADEAKADEANAAEAKAAEAKADEAKAARAKAAEARLQSGIDARLADAIDARLTDGAGAKTAEAATSTATTSEAKSGPVTAPPSGPLPVISVPSFRRIPPPPPQIPTLGGRSSGPTIELDGAADILDVTPEHVGVETDSTKRHAGLPPRTSRQSEDVGAAVEAALDAISDATQNIGEVLARASEPVLPAEAAVTPDAATAAEAPPATEAAPTVAAEAAKSERKSLPRALIIETGAFAPLPKPEAN